MRLITDGLVVDVSGKCHGATWHRRSRNRLEMPMGKNAAQPRRDGGKRPTVTPPSALVVTMSSIAMLLAETGVTSQD